MKMAQSALKFNGYEVQNIYFEKNDAFFTKDNNEVELSPSFQRKIFKNDKNDYIVELGFEIKPDLEGNLVPFTLKVNIAGCFTFDDDDDTLVKENAVAILFPYLRALISTITANANIPPLILPTINIVEMLKQEEVQEKIKAVDKK
ncbi:MAG TPA: protein-export chaperone SecB [Oscillospiraceae bacterium]|nr:protein-export chaperone SecB [Oscillospiraceae bacterium]